MLNQARFSAGNLELEEDRKVMWTQELVPIPAGAGVRASGAVVSEGSEKPSPRKNNRVRSLSAVGKEQVDIALQDALKLSVFFQFI